MEVLLSVDLPALYRMLEDSDDFPQNLLYLYRRGGTAHPAFVAWRGNAVEGFLSGSFDADFRGERAFDSFELPTPPHAFLERVHVHPRARNRGVGRALIEEYAAAAVRRGCTFIGGSIDLSSEPTLRRIFFENLGFVVEGHDNFGVQPTDILATRGLS